MITISEKISGMRHYILSLPLIFPLLGFSTVFLIGTAAGNFGISVSAMIIAMVILTFVVVQRQDEIIVMLIIAVHLYVDWYLVYHLVAFVLAILLIGLFYLTRSPERPWVSPPALRLWLVFLILAAFPAARGALTLRDLLLYYPAIVFGALLMFWLGALLARNVLSVRRLFQALSFFGALIAIHTIIQNTTGKTLFGSARADAYLLTVLNHTLAPGLTVTRSGSFFNDPNWNGAFLVMMFFLALGLFVYSSSLWAKLLYLAEALIMLPALLFTYSTASWSSLFVGLIFFIILIGRTLDRIQFIISVAIAALILFFFFNSQILLQLQHSTNAQDLASRVALLQTAWRIIQANPLTGIGLGHANYLLLAAPYHVPMDYIPLDHPHNSYMEWAAMAGLPVLFVFLALLATGVWLAIQNWRKADAQARSLLGGGLALIIALSFNSWSNDCWTLPPLAAIGWLILGAISSPIPGKGSLENEARIINNLRAVDS